MKLLFEASAPVRGPLAEVRRLIDGDAVLDHLLGADGRAYVDVDRRPGVVGYQGHWWFRGFRQAPRWRRLLRRRRTTAGRRRSGIPWR